MNEFRIIKKHTIEDDELTHHFIIEEYKMVWVFWFFYKRPEWVTLQEQCASSYGQDYVSFCNVRFKTHMDAKKWVTDKCKLRAIVIPEIEIIEEINCSK